MADVVIQSLATAVPRRRYSQDEIYERFLEPVLGRNRRARAIFKRSGIAYRHAAIPGDYYDCERGTAERNATYMEEALPLGRATIECALGRAGLAPEAIDDFTVVSCTGLDIPGLDLRLAGALGMRPDLRRTAIGSMGCYGAFPALRRAVEAVIARPGSRALVLSVELCSLHLQLDDSTENVVACALFADGAAALVLGGEGPGARVIDSLVLTDYATMDHMAFSVTNHGFRMHLSAYVPQALAANVTGFAGQLLARNGLRPADVRFWGVHPGGVAILDRVQTALGLSAEQMSYSRRVLHDYGNMSSPTILFVLEGIEREGRPEPGDYGLFMAFGPGLTMESCLLQWT
jgi:predicted naringenin-chalcone synthase